MEPRWTDVAAIDAVSETTPLVVELEGNSIVILRCGATLYAIEDKCTHDGESFAGAEVEDCQIICPRHFSRFCLRTGEALTPPAYEPVRTYEVREQNGRVLVAERA